jgi:hypothetical protein
LRLERLFVVHPGEDCYVMHERIEAVSLAQLRARWAQLGATKAKQKL